MQPRATRSSGGIAPSSVSFAAAKIPDTTNAAASSGKVAEFLVKSSAIALAANSSHKYPPDRSGNFGMRSASAPVPVERYPRTIIHLRRPSLDPPQRRSRCVNNRQEPRQHREHHSQHASESMLVMVIPQTFRFSQRGIEPCTAGGLATGVFRR
jgi:hypothetical protein